MVSNLDSVSAQIMKGEAFVVVRALGMPTAVRWFRAGHGLDLSHKGHVARHGEVPLGIRVCVGAPKKDYEEQLFENVRVAALVQMLPGDLRDVVCHGLHLSGDPRQGPETRLEPPMDVGLVVDDCDDGEVEECLGAVGKGFRECDACGEHRHFGRECVLGDGRTVSRKGQTWKGNQWGGKGKGSHESVMTQNGVGTLTHSGGRQVRRESVSRVHATLAGVGATDGSNAHVEQPSFEGGAQDRGSEGCSSV